MLQPGDGRREEDGMGKEALMWERADWNDQPPALTWAWALEGVWALTILSSLPLIPNIGLSVGRENQLSKPFL